MTGARRACIRTASCGRKARRGGRRAGVGHSVCRSSLPREAKTMKIRNSLKSAKIRDKDCRVVRRHGRVYVINKKNPRMKARQG
ncbi:50S ribosomal protein L36P [Acidomonas methanolica NBRC 104435]|uniref:Large ribosomal subunit protein bL36 n=1 Tax=Acidomonas methanolica NBRC 104435 TaxID=1231351 RepID=A0A023D373_ACIMT|nr:50S ribosomal protein L36P [Acidomonas methanolica NBRC 104435]GEK98766.1 hypothetical protein AME01nite_12650 [Acidomonas methanolica NBRC 104435]